MFPEELVLKLADSSDKPVTDCAVVVESEPGSELSAQPQMIRSDAEGMVRLRVTTGNRLGDNYLRIIPKGAESMSLVCRFVIGIELLKGNREGGQEYFSPIRLRFAWSTPVEHRSRDEKSISNLFRLRQEEMRVSSVWQPELMRTEWPRRASHSERQPESTESKSSPPGRTGDF